MKISLVQPGIREIASVDIGGDLLEMGDQAIFTELHEAA